MRITNRIMQRNNLSNINTNKIYQDKLSNQMSSQKKITRPSDDPVVAIRALRLRSNVTEITQYYSKNIPDAGSWLKVTEDAISNLSQIITNMIARCNKGVNNYLETEDRNIILKEMKSLAESVYSTGDADYAGRYVFTGYRTDTSLSFLAAKEQEYTITEQLDSSAIDTVTKVDTDKLLDINGKNFADAGMDVDEDDITSVEAYRIRLAYNDCSGYADFDAAKTQMDDLKKKLESYGPYFKAVGFDMTGLDFNNLSQANLDNIKKAVADLKQLVEGINNGTVQPPSPGGGSTSGPGTGSGGSIDIDIGTILDWDNKTNDKLADDKLKELEEWGDDWTKAGVDIEDLASPVIEFTGTDGKTHVWKGFAGAGTATDKTDDTVTETGVITLMHSYENPYAYASANEDSIVYVPETGEILLGAKRYEELMGTKDREDTPNLNEAEIRVTYSKSNWQKGDLRPEHYFYCEAATKDADGNDTTIKYNESYIDPKLSAERQIIEYDVGYNQTVRINSTADECFKHGIGREVDDIVNAMQDVLDLEGAQTDIENIIKSLEADSTADPDGSKMEILKKQQAAVKKALELAKQKEQSLFAGGITELQKYLDDANLCVTDCGTRSSKLELIKNRSQNQKTTYETLKSENEDIDITEVAIELSAAELTYDSALMAAGKVMQNTLLNFI